MRINRTMYKPHQVWYGHGCIQNSGYRWWTVDKSWPYTFYEYCYNPHVGYTSRYDPNQNRRVRVEKEPT